ncbi:MULTISPECIES: signal peptidase I [unclassified Nocardioides]|uniref:signal peptidase I n=1 Tax=unclassified Nocardioides TaxID=2615069 RepID=UPI00070286BD|nr:MULTISPECIES: signal peptidase I [unclassified Nocardioides]KRC46206.1 hypothetical protein ASE19_20310 [Nocardioides sp. Root79]KRC69554.1 hypothetical protein ASE20_13170 [Nocardioides sp. Root240]
MTTTETEIRALARRAADDISAPPGLAARALRGARRTRRRRAAVAAGVVVVGAGVSWGAGLIGSGPYYEERQPSEGMAPTVAAGDVVAFHRDLVAVPGDLVELEVADVPVPLLRRVVAVGGETVSCPARTDGTCAAVLVDGRVLGNDYVDALVTEPFAAVQVPAGEVFVLGDNRAYALDSRTFGPVPLDDVTGVAVAIRSGDDYVAIPGAPRHRPPDDSDLVDLPGPPPVPGVAQVE